MPIIINLLFIFLNWFHPFYVSVINLEHNPKNQSVEISIKIFKDDLEKTLNQLNTQKIDIQSEKDRDLINLYINNYIQQKLKVQINSKSTILNFVGYEIQSESVWSYFEIEKVSIFEKININCSILYDYSDKQTNIFHIKSADHAERSSKLEHPNVSVDF